MEQYKLSQDCGPCSVADYDKMVEETFETVRELGQMKGSEYSGDNDRLDNFRRVAATLNLLPEQVWAVYIHKHFDAVLRHVSDLDVGRLRVRSEPLESRVDDIIVYMLLFKAMLAARR